MSACLGSYETRSQLDHDMSQMVAALLSEMQSRDVDRVDALASLRRVVRAPVTTP